MRELREKLRKEILAWERGGAVHHPTVDELNRLMADHANVLRCNVLPSSLRKPVTRSTDHALDDLRDTSGAVAV